MRRTASKLKRARGEEVKEGWEQGGWIGDRESRTGWTRMAA